MQATGNYDLKLIIVVLLLSTYPIVMHERNRKLEKHPRIFYLKQSQTSYDSGIFSFIICPLAVGITSTQTFILIFLFPICTMAKLLIGSFLVQ